jgi:transcriptional regulator with XRE-family HTH domain
MELMKIDAALVRQLREERAWPQEHLASVAGLSLRTIQRVEADGSASADTRMALAAAFGVDVARLGLQTPLPAPAPVPEAAPASAPAATSSPAPAPAPHIPPMQPAASALKLSRFQYRCLRFMVIVGLLVGLDVYESGRLTWSKWVLLFGVAFLLLRILKTQLVEPDSAPPR